MDRQLGEGAPGALAGVALAVSIRRRLLALGRNVLSSLFSTTSVKSSLLSAGGLAFPLFFELAFARYLPRSSSISALSLFLSASLSWPACILLGVLLLLFPLVYLAAYLSSLRSSGFATTLRRKLATPSTTSGPDHDASITAVGGSGALLERLGSASTPVSSSSSPILSG